MSVIAKGEDFFKGSVIYEEDTAPEALLIASDKYPNSFSVCFGGEDKDGNPIWYYGKIEEKLLESLKGAFKKSKSGRVYVKLYSLRYAVNEKKRDGTDWKNGKPHVYITGASLDAPATEDEDHGYEF